MNMKHLLAILLVITLAPQAFAETPFIGISGQGIVNMKPDKAEIKIHIIQRTRNITAAKNKIDQIVTNLMSSMSTYKNVVSIMSTQFRVLEDVNQETGVIRGLRASRSITLGLSDITKVNDIIDIALAAGVNNVEKINFTVSNERDVFKKARQKAVKDAIEKATDFSEIFNSKVGGVLSIQDANYPHKRYTNNRILSETRVDDRHAEIFIPETVEYKVVVFVKLKINP